jgi:hypothetical protein
MNDDYDDASFWIMLASSIVIIVITLGFILSNTFH